MKSTQLEELKNLFHDICGSLSIEEILSNVELMEMIISIESLLYGDC